jgi:hypothetical protein
MGNNIERGQVWRMTMKARGELPAPPKGWPRVVEVRGTMTELELALAISEERIGRFSIPFSVLRQHYRRSPQ